MKKVIHKGETYYSVADAAKYLGTRADKIREMMGNGTLQYKQLKTNGPLLILATSLVYKKEREGK